MAGNPLFDFAAGTGVSVTTNPYSVASVEYNIRKRFRPLWVRAMPLLKRIQDGKSNWNKAGLVKANAVLHGMTFADASTPAAGRAIADEFTAKTPTAPSGLTNSQWTIAQYDGFVWNKASMQQLVNNAHGNLLEALIEQIMSSFYNAQVAHLMGTAAGADNAFHGIQQILHTTNTVAGVDQSTYTNFASNLATAVGPFSLDLVSDYNSAVSNRNGMIDTILASYSSSNNLYGKYKAAVAPALRVVNPDYKFEYNIENIEHDGALVIQEGRLTAGVMIGLTSKTWFYNGHEKPQRLETVRMQGTTAQEMAWNMFGCVSCNDPGANWRATGMN